MKLRAMMLTVASVGTLLGMSGTAVAGNPSYYFGGTIKAATSGDVSLTFYEADTDGNDSLSVNGGMPIFSDANVLTPSGTTYDLGYFNAGEALTFTVKNSVLGSSFDSTSDNFRTVVDTEPFYGFNTPYFGFEDTPLSGPSQGDHDYNDVAFGLSNVTFTPSVPEPATWALMTLGIGLVGGALRGRKLGLGLSGMSGITPMMA